MKQDALFRIAQTWNLNLEPEYRGFRCANCQRYIAKAWHHWLSSRGYRNPVHLCQQCEAAYKKGEIAVKGPKRPVLMSRFFKNLSGNVRAKLKRISRQWHLGERPVYKTFACDQCRKPLRKAYHVWAHLDKNLTETHLCRHCGKILLEG
jgi:RNase P subunit RPR2